MKGPKLFAVPLLLSLFAIAAASLMVVWSTVGRGQVRNREGRVGFFHVDASRTAHRGTVHTRGFVILEFPSTNASTPGDRLKIEVVEYGQEANTSLVAGPAVFRHVTSSGVHEYHGRGKARFVSRKHHDEVGDPDSMEASFFIPEGNFQWSFGGHVTSGDVTIAKTESY